VELFEGGLKDEEEIFPGGAAEDSDGMVTEGEAKTFLEESSMPRSTKYPSTADAKTTWIPNDRSSS
jgi:hypothetical protein